MELGSDGDDEPRRKAMPTACCCFQGQRHYAVDLFRFSHQVQCSAATKTLPRIKQPVQETAHSSAELPSSVPGQARWQDREEPRKHSLDTALRCSQRSYSPGKDRQTTGE